MLTTNQQVTIEGEFEREEIVLFDDNVEIGSCITFPRLKELVERIEDYVGTIDTDQ